MDPDPGDEHYFQIFTDSFNKIRIFFLFLYATTLKPKPEIRTFFQQFRSSFESKRFLHQFLVDILPLDPDPGSQNVADPTDPKPKHWFKINKNI